MELSVYVLGREVATPAPAGDFKSVLSDHPQVATDDFVSLTMPVRTESCVWDDQLPPVLQMDLPEGFLLQLLQEQFGPHIVASPMALLSVIGRNMVGRLQVAAPGAELSEPAKPVEAAALLKGDNSEAAFAALGFDVDDNGQAHWGMEDFSACSACAPPPSTTPPGSASPKPCATTCPAPSGRPPTTGLPPPCC